MTVFTWQHHPPVKEGQELMLVVALQAVGSHGTEDGSDPTDAQRSSQEASVEQNLLLLRLQLVGYVMRVDVEIFERECYHRKHDCAWKVERQAKSQNTITFKLYSFYFFTSDNIY